MSSPINPQDKHGTYVRKERYTVEDLALLQNEEQMMNIATEDILREQPEPTSLQGVLDVGCGTGQWLIEVAKTYPEISQLVGIDINAKVIEYANAQAEAQQVAERVQFRVMDALGFLDFPDDSFDLVNQRLGGSFLRTWDWNKLLHNFKRVTRSAGVIRIVEADMIESTSSAQMQQVELLLQAFHRSGHAFTPQKDGLTSELVSLLRQQGFQNVQTAIRTLHYSEETLEGQFLSLYLKQMSRSLQSFQQKWNREPDGEVINRQVLEDMKRPDFAATWTFITVWANNPPKG